MSKTTDLIKQVCQHLADLGPIENNEDRFFLSEEGRVEYALDSAINLYRAQRGDHTEERMLRLAMELYTVRQGKTYQNMCVGMEYFLVTKNEAYGDSAMSPVRIFSTASTEEQLNVRLDDKLSRMLLGRRHGGEDTLKDFIGYLILKEVYRRL